MARRQLDEINAGSMADIAFLLLIFFLVTTTMDFDSGIKRTLPQKVDPNTVENVKVLKRNVLEVKANLNDELMVNGMQMEVAELKDKTIEFMTNPQNKEDLPAIIHITEQRCNGEIDTLKMNLRDNPESEMKEVWEGDLKEWEARLDAVKLVGPFDVIPKLCVITVQTDNQTSYKLYIEIQNALKQAINELRNKWCMQAYNKKFTDLKETEEADVEKIRVIRAIVPERIAEIEPRNIQEF